MVDSADRNFARSLLDHIRSKSGRALSKTIEDVQYIEWIVEYLEEVKDITVNYTKNQFLLDLINLLKNGQGSVAKPLIDMLGFEGVRDDLSITFVDYKDIPDAVD